MRLLLTDVGREGALLIVLVQEEAIHTGSDALFDAFECLYGEVEQVACQLAIVGHWVERAETYRVYNFLVVLALEERLVHSGRGQVHE